MKNLLFLLDYYMENASANGICCKNVAQEIVRRGYRVAVGTYRPASAPETEVIDGVQICKTWTKPSVPHHKSKKEKLLFYMRWLWPRNRFPITEVPERTEAIYNTAKQIILEQKIDTVICVHLPVETLIAGIKLKADFPNVKFCGYMLDSMSGGILPRFLPGCYTRLCKIRWEANLLNQMDISILMESSREHHRKYTSKQQWMLHAKYCDIPQIIQLDDSIAIYNGEQTVRMAFVGTLADNIRTPYYFLNVLKKVTKYHIELTIAGNNRCREDFDKILEGVNHVKINYLGTVPHDKSVEILKRAHILVNFGNLNSILVPSKIFEYMSIGKPIVSTYRRPQDPARSYLAKYPYVLEMDERYGNLNFQAKALEDFIGKMNGVIISSNCVTEMFWSNTPGAFIETLVDGFVDQ